MNVLVLEDDPWLSELLVEVLKSIEPEVHVHCFDRTAQAMDYWSDHGADMILCDWVLPDMSGVELLRQVHASDHAPALVVITAKAERELVLTSRKLGVRHFITKPFDARELQRRLSEIIKSHQQGEADGDGEPAQPELPQAGSLSSFLEHTLQGELAVSLFDGAEQLEELLGLQAQDEVSPAELARRWVGQPVISAKLLTVANSQALRSGGGPLLSLQEAIMSIGVQNSISLSIAICMAGARLAHSPLLRERAREMEYKGEHLAAQVAALARGHNVNAGGLIAAAVLHRAGELAVLHATNRWCGQGGELDSVLLDEALKVFGPRFGNAVKVRWRIPFGLRALIGAVYVLPQGVVTREMLLMRIASLQSEEEEGSQRELERLKSRAGLSA
ncbi:MAG: response regulator [Ectothiorhodospiraceae bacterium]|nr:response regulator [Ectothiorhodospiraceae bacterium]